MSLAPNYVCAGCGYQDPVGRTLSGRPLTPDELRASLMLHSHYSGLCPVTRTSIDPTQEETTMTTTIRDLDFSGGESAPLVRYPDRQPALWVTDEYLAGVVETPGTYTLNDVNTSIPLFPDEDIDNIVEGWKAAVSWGDVVEDWEDE